jgi:hypothetical protein
MSEETESLIIYKGGHYSKTQAEDVANYLTALLEDTLSIDNTSSQAVTTYETNVKRLDTIIRMGDDSYANKPPQRKSKPVPKEVKPIEKVVRSQNNTSSKIKQPSDNPSTEGAICRRNLIFVHKIDTPSNRGKSIEDCKNARCSEYHHAKYKDWSKDELKKGILKCRSFRSKEFEGDKGAILDFINKMDK